MPFPMPHLGNKSLVKLNAWVFWGNKVISGSIYRAVTNTPGWNEEFVEGLNYENFFKISQNKIAEPSLK